MAEADDLLEQGKKLFADAEEAETDNRTASLADIQFAREGKQWPEHIVAERNRERRPMLTINKLPTFIRQVVNDARQNKPGISVHPADSNADPETAEVIAGLIRNIETTSNADVAYDTATECAVQGGIGYLRVGLDYAYEDSFEMDLSIKRVSNPFSVYGDPNSVEADSSDWMDSFVVERLTERQFKAKWKGKAKTNWDDADAWGEGSWREADEVMVAEWWHRTEEDIEVQQFMDLRSNSLVSFTAKDLAEDEDLQLLAQAGVLEFKRKRTSKSYKVKQHFMSGAEVLETRDWPGCYIPIIPVYGEEFDVKGKRYFRGLVHNAIDAQRMFNYWRTTATELVALAPRVPYIGPKGAFDSDPRWETANTESHPFLEYDVKGTGGAPQRQPLDSGVAAGALQEALNASDDMKAVIGMYDASLGARSNETSGKAIMARQREGDVSTFHFIDNMSRAIRHTGRILIDLIPHVYNAERVIRVMGEDGKPSNVPLKQQYPQMDEKGQQVQDDDGQPIMRMHDLALGKYDLTVKAGPGFTSRREEAANGMTQIIQAYPDAAPIIAPELFKNLDWPGAEKIAEKFEAQSEGPQIPPEVQQMIQEGQAKITDLEQQLAAEKQSNAADQQKVQGQLDLQKQKQDGDFALQLRKINAEKHLELAKMGMEEQPGETDEMGAVKSNDQVRSEAIMQGLQMLGQLVATEGQATRAALQQIAATISAPTVLERDASGRAVGARKVLVN